MTRTTIPAITLAVILVGALCLFATPAQAHADESALTPAQSVSAAKGSLKSGASSKASAKDLKTGKAALDAGVKVYRLYNPKTGENFYTKNKKERRRLIKQNGWKSKGVGWIAPKKSSTPVYRLFNPSSGEHHFTTDKQERRELVKNQGWVKEGIGWYSADPGSVRMSVYHAYDASKPAFNHFYTAKCSKHVRLINRGWHAEGIAWYALASTDSIKKGWINKGKSWFFYKHGKRLTSRWITTKWAPGLKGAATDKNSGRQRYWLDSKGRLAVKRLINPKKKKDAAAKYYAYARKTGAVVRGVFDTGRGRVFIAGKNGRLTKKTGWLVTRKYEGSRERYYIEKKTHAAKTGLFEVDGKLYWGMTGSGHVARNTRIALEGRYYNADNHGVLTEDTVVNSLIDQAQGYSSPSNYLIMVDIDDPRTIVFAGSQGNWNVKFIWDCDTGAPDTPTILGVYHVGIKGYSFGENHGYSCYYYTQFCGNYLFHTRKYYPYTHDLLDARMGERISEGCVRLYDEDAIWIQDNIPEGTTVVTTY